MKVLPGMQSAFVDIGLERDAFLYVSDFLDVLEDEAIEIKSDAPGSAGRGKREAADAADEAQAAAEAEATTAGRSSGRDRDRDRDRRTARDSKPEAVPEAEEDNAEFPPADTPAPMEAVRDDDEDDDDDESDADAAGGRRRRRRRRRRRGDEVAPGMDEYDVPQKAQVLDSFGDDDASRLRIETAYEHIEEVQFADTAPSVLEAGASNFERVSDDDAPPRERARRDVPQIVESAPSFPTYEAPVEEMPAPMLVAIRDEDDLEASVDAALDAVAAPAKGRSRKAKAEPAAKAAPKTAAKKTAAKKDKDADSSGDEAPKKARAKKAPSAKAASKPPRGKARKSALADAEAEVSDSPSRAEMSTRRGGRGRRRSSGPREGDGGTPEAAAAERSPEPEKKERTERNDRGERSDRPERERPASGNGRSRRSEPLISELLREGQEITVQIAKEPIAKKGARITSHIVLPGRFLVFMPTVTHVGVSRKVTSEGERTRLKKTVSALKEKEGGPGGFIARTAAIGQSDEDLLDDMRYLQRTWAELKREADRRKAPALLHRDLDLVQRILRDQISDDFSAIRVDNEIEYARIVDFVNRVQPRLVRRVKLHTRDESILETYGVQAELDKAVKPRVWLKSGGYIVINQTEALVSIDVNTGKFVGKSDRLEDTITRTNMEAVREIVRQVRLRDLGGIIVIDFIDMEERRNRMKVTQALEAEMRADRSPSKVLGFNDFGLIIITRKRVKQSLERTLCSPCPYCQGAGLVKSTQTMAFEILTEARRISKHLDGQADDVTLRVSPGVAQALRSSESAIFEEIEAHFSSPVRLKVDHELHQEQFDFAIL
ncbi:MAG: Rne/Rng family ribonuclease [Acidobacteria bacterium]|nr:Rne/Rng family ribonuclease [Acidobacteriota bacterium]